MAFKYFLGMAPVDDEIDSSSLTRYKFTGVTSHRTHFYFG